MGCKRLTSSNGSLCCSSSCLSSTFCCSCPPLPQLHTQTHKITSSNGSLCCFSSSLSSTFWCSCPPLPQLHTQTNETKGKGGGGCLLGKQSACPQDYWLYRHTMSWIINLDMIFYWNCWELYSQLLKTIYCLNHWVIITNTQQKVYFAYFFPMYWNSEKLHLRLHNFI